MNELRLQTSRARALRGHPWAFRNELRQPFPDCAGEGVLLRAAGGRLLGSGIFNPGSEIAWRAYSREETRFDRAFLEEAIGRAIARRAENPFLRLVWSEADRLPGLVLDQFDDTLVVQALTLAMDRRLPEIVSILQARLDPGVIVLRNDAPSRTREGLPREVRTAGDVPCPPRWYEIDGLACFLDLQKGQKTGFYLDQREQHARVAEFAPGKRVLDAFCNQGSFALHAARAGAVQALGIDSSEECIAAARNNAARNGLAAEFLCANVFDWFTENRDARFDVIVLDPPSFAPRKAAVTGAMRGYKELNLRALRMLGPGGILATYSCSQHVSREIFLAMLRDAAADAGREARLLTLAGQPPDHPVALHFPESEYLTGAILEVE